MTDQSNTPVPPRKTPEGRSLFERATEAFDIKGFQPAKVPENLAEAPVKRGREARPNTEKARHVEPAPLPATLPKEVAQSAPEPVIQAPAPAAAQDAAKAVKPVSFNGARHSVDRARLRELGLIQPDGAITALLEEFRIVKRQLLESARASLAGRGAPNGQRVLICSPHSGEGKTFCAVNLALALAAERDSEVLLVDADFAKPSVLSSLGLPGGKGFMDALADPSINVEDCVIPTDVTGFYVLPAGSQTNNDSEYLASSRTSLVLDRLTRGAPNRMVIFDSPPALAASPAAELAQYVGQAVLVVRADQTGLSALEDACSLLAACPDIKLLLNAAHFSPSGRTFGTYYGYGA